MHLFEMREIGKSWHVLLNDLCPSPSVDLRLIQPQEVFSKSNNSPVAVKFSLEV